MNFPYTLKRICASTWPSCCATAGGPCRSSGACLRRGAHLLGVAVTHHPPACTAAPKASCGSERRSPMARSCAGFADMLVGEESRCRSGDQCADGLGAQLHIARPRQSVGPVTTPPTRLRSDARFAADPVDLGPLHRHQFAGTQAGVRTRSRHVLFVARACAAGFSVGSDVGVDLVSLALVVCLSSLLARSG